MNNLAHEQFEASLLGKVRPMLEGIDLANGTPLADALAAAVMVDLRQSRNKDAAAIIHALDEDAISNLGAGLVVALSHEHHMFTLPFGTKVRSNVPGSIFIGPETWVTDAGRSGLFALETVRRDAHGPNLELLRDTISQAVKNKPWQCIGLPSPLFIPDIDRYLLRFPPFSKAGGVVLQRGADETGAASFASATHKQIKDLARSMVDDMKALWRRREEVARQSDATRLMVEAEMATSLRSVPINSVAIEWDNRREEERLGFHIAYDTLDDALRRGIVLYYQPAPVEGKAACYPIPFGIQSRGEQRDLLRAVGADGEIDALAAAVVQHAPDGAANTLAHLASDHDALVTFMTDDGPIYAFLFWRSGCITVDLVAPGRIEQCASRLELNLPRMDEDAVQALVGRPLTSVCPLPFDANCTIFGANSLSKGKVRLNFEGPRSFVNCSTGHIWDQ